MKNNCSPLNFFDNTRKILLSLRDPFSRTLLARQLRIAGYQVLETSNSQEAIHFIKDLQPELVVCDWQLEDQSGTEFCRRVRADIGSSLPYLILLVEERGKDLDSIGYESGADECLESPCDPSQLLRSVKTGFRIAELQQFLARRNEEHQQLTARLNQELSSVSNIQKALLPQIVPRTSAFDFTAFYLPSSECGGDYYDLVQLDEDRQGFVIADVSGHGAPAMVAMALIRQDFHVVSKTYDEPSELLEHLNRLLYDHLPTDQFATMFYAIINTKTLEFSYSSAGHTPPIWYRAETRETERLKHCEGFPLKLVMREASYKTHKIQIKSGDQLVFYTDGIPECFNPKHEMYGMSRFEKIIGDKAPDLNPRQMETALVTDLMKYADNHPQEDDLTLAIIGVH